MAGIYIHIPFCSQFCIYCDFYSIRNKKDRVEKYIESLLCEIEQRSDFFKNCKIKPTTIYIGGGTPSLLSSDNLSKIVKSVYAQFGIDTFSQIQEFTIEVNPDDLTKDYLIQLKDIGINRLSIGIQSFFDEDLLWMNRRHDSHKAIEAFFMARDCGFTNISVDLMFGFSLLTEQKLISNLERLISIRPEHLSLYQLGIEKGTPLGKSYECGEYVPLSDDNCSLQYSLIQNMLSKAGYIQYEISNFSLPGKEALHNSSYWEHKPYIGFGPSAHSFDGKIRSWNCSSLSKYCSFLQVGDRCFKCENLSPRNIFNEKIMLSLRRTVGADLQVLRDVTPPEIYSLFQQQLENALKRGEVIMDGNKIKIPPDRFFVSDGIIRDLMVV
ncbi:MAG: radical SAM family heme chaperone HemW [Bacteroidales bacterium]|nr:radical SAM family heme chaperone HemW [Bacteroidales bacterium]